MRRLATLVGLAIVLLVAGAPVAAAGTVGTGPGDAVGFTAGASEANRVTVSTSADRLIVSDVGVASMAVSGGCAMVDPQTASCPATPQTRLTVRGGDLDDEITNAAGIGAELLGGDGHDVLRGSVAPDRLDGEAGPDDLDGGPGDDVLAAGPGPPVVDADTVAGGPGTDAISYAARSTGVDVSEDGIANDGGSGEDDNVAVDIEQLTGSSAADRLTGGPGPNLVDGGPGADAIDGGAGGDIVQGGAGTDSLRGGPGADQLLGGPDRDVVAYAPTLDVTASLEAGAAGSSEPGDTDRVADVEDVTGGESVDTLTGARTANALTGADGQDYIDGREGVDRLEGGSDADVVVSRDSTRDESVSCGSGADLAIVDRRDPVDRSGPGRCERVDDGTRTKPRPGDVYLDRMRCSAGNALGLNLPAMRRWVPLRYSILLPVGFRGRGSPQLAASNCTVRVTATPGRGRSVAADVSGATVSVRQSSGRRVTTTLSVARPRCGSGAGRRAVQARDRRVRLKTQRRAGSWRVRGRYSIGASVGTDWTTLEGCARTVTIVRRGRVRVFDRAKRRTVVVRAGQRYVARRR
jgi:Ca2+-binding RTX toxin-like protein